MTESVILYVLTAILTVFLVAVSYRLSHRCPSPYLTFNFLHLAFFSLVFFASRPIPSLIRQALQMDDRQRLNFSAVNLSFILLPLTILVLYLQIRFAAAWLGVTIARTFNLAYFSVFGAYVIAFGGIAFRFLTSGTVPSPVALFLRSRDWIFTLLDFSIFIWMIFSSRRLTDPARKRGIGIYGCLGFLGLAVYNAASLAGLSGVPQPLLFLAQPIPALVYLARHVKSEWARRPAIGEADLDRGAAVFRISVRERDIIRLIGQGLSNSEIAERLFLSPQTVKNQIHALFLKLEVKNRVQLINVFRNTPDRFSAGGRYSPDSGGD